MTPFLNGFAEPGNAKIRAQNMAALRRPLFIAALREAWEASTQESWSSMFLQFQSSLEIMHRDTANFGIGPLN
jgi:hypothetical protein